MKRLTDMVPNWWKELLRYWLEDLKEDWYDIDKITYIKEKYWTMRIEWPHNDIISDIETASWYFCETCGSAGRLRTDLWWHRTLCDKHYRLKKNWTGFKDMHKDEICVWDTIRLQDTGVLDVSKDWDKYIASWDKEFFYLDELNMNAVAIFNN